MTDQTDNDQTNNETDALIEAIWREDISDYILIELLEGCIDRDVLEWMQ
jgi:hypothetical protein